MDPADQPGRGHARGLLGSVDAFWERGGGGVGAQAAWASRKVGREGQACGDYIELPFAFNLQ